MPQTLRRVGRYELVRQIGRGGMAVVYLARQAGLEREVALKELVADPDPALAERFLRESRLAGSLNHPNVVTVYDYLEQEGVPYIAMEYLERGSLRPLIGKLTFAQIAGVLEGLLAGLKHAASRGIVHRDLKPENVLVTDEGAVKIADFGIAKAYNRLATARFLTKTGTTIGTPTYMAPEQAMGKPIGPPTDLYSTGVIAYEMLVGQVPFSATDTPLAILMRQVHEPIPPPRSLNPDLDDRLAGWLERMLAKAPQERPPSAEAAWEEYEGVICELLGPTWRREARLTGETADPKMERALTPAPFHEEKAESSPWEDPETGDYFVTFRRRPPAPPEVEEAPADPTPAPGPSRPRAEHEAEAREERGFLREPRASQELGVPGGGSGTADREGEPGGAEARDQEFAGGALAADLEATVPPRLRPVAKAGTQQADTHPPVPPVGAPAPSPGPQSTPPGSGDTGRHRRWFGWVAVLMALAVGAAAVLVMRPGGDSPPPARADEPIQYRTSAYTAVLPSGWRVRCRERQNPCGGSAVPFGVLRSAFDAVAGDTMTIDRSEANKVTLTSLIRKQDAALSKQLRGYRRDGESPVDLGGRRARELAFSSNDPRFGTGVAYAFKANGDAYILTAAAPSGETIRRVAKRVAEGIRTQR